MFNTTALLSVPLMGNCQTASYMLACETRSRAVLPLEASIVLLILAWQQGPAVSQGHPWGPLEGTLGGNPRLLGRL